MSSDMRRIKLACLVLVTLLVGCTSKTQQYPFGIPSSKTPLDNQQPLGTIPAATSTSDVNIPSTPPGDTVVSPKVESTDVFPTALPDLNPANAKEVLLQFVKNNGGCQLPCILGLTPGHTTRLEVDSFIDYFANHAYQSSDQIDHVDIMGRSDIDSGGMALIFWENRRRIAIYLSYKIDGEVLRSLTYSSGVYLHSGEGVEERAKTLYDDPAYAQLLRNFSISSILTTFGQPSQILIAPMPDYPGYPSPPAQYNFDFVLFYQEQGIVVEYITIRQDEGEYYLGCPNSAQIYISTWDPKEQIDLSEAIKNFSGVNSVNPSNFYLFRELLTIGTMNIEGFYDTFKISDLDPCLKVPRNIWPTN